MKPQIKMLKDVMDLLLTQNKTAKEAYDGLLDIMAYKLSYEEMISIPWLKIDIWNQIQTILDLTVLQEEVRDWFGEIHQIYGLNGNFYTTEAELEKAPALSMGSSIRRILDDCAGSGRLIMNYYSAYKDHFIYYGVEHDLTAYRTALINMKLHGIHAMILCCDKTKYDISQESPNWRFVNRWKPVRTQSLFTTEDIAKQRERILDVHPKFKKAIQ